MFVFLPAVDTSHGQDKREYTQHRQSRNLDLMKPAFVSMHLLPVNFYDRLTN